MTRRRPRQLPRQPLPLPPHQRPPPQQPRPLRPRQPPRQPPPHRRPPQQQLRRPLPPRPSPTRADRKSTRLNSSHLGISYAVFCLKKKNSAPRPRRDRSTPALPGRLGRRSRECTVARVPASYDSASFFFF